MAHVSVTHQGEFVNGMGRVVISIGITAGNRKEYDYALTLANEMETHVDDLAAMVEVGDIQDLTGAKDDDKAAT